MRSFWRFRVIAVCRFVPRPTNRMLDVLVSSGPDGGTSTVPGKDQSKSWFALGVGTSNEGIDKRSQLPINSETYMSQSTIWKHFAEPVAVLTGL